MSQPLTSLEIQHFFEVYKALEPGKEVEAATWVGLAAAEDEILACRARLAAAASWVTRRRTGHH